MANNPRIGIDVGGITVAMTDAIWDPSLMRQLKDMSAIVMHVAMHNVIRGVLLQNAPEVVGIAPGSRRVQAGNYFRTEGTDLIIIGTGCGSMNSEVYAETVTVYMTQHVHQPGFDSSPIHGANDLQDADPLGSFVWCYHSDLPQPLSGEDGFSRCS